ncbi:hypothetical protein M408DRAFT_280887 [Serendipita vermifera MAFF 305830]|uniref:Uncharacterized protein n=1 Tax=Serendipita vermifera MAFF 305830 TaxID=933852 RepID=A0A0C3ATY5_SERVB|nr:hypothetical protein M408DRAFT_280887 [Serendipita vermifera MAFF 305830]
MTANEAMGTTKDISARDGHRYDLRDKRYDAGVRHGLQSRTESVQPYEGPHFLIPFCKRCFARSSSRPFLRAPSSRFVSGLQHLPCPVGLATELTFVHLGVPGYKHEAPQLFRTRKWTRAKARREVVPEALVRLLHRERNGVIGNHAPFSAAGHKCDTLELVELDVCHPPAVRAGHDDEVEGALKHALYEFHKLVEPSDHFFGVVGCGEHERSDKGAPIGEIFKDVGKCIKGVESPGRRERHGVS